MPEIRLPNSTIKVSTMKTLPQKHPWGSSPGNESARNQMSIRNQIRPMLTLALPLILAEVGWMSMGIVDTIMVGHMANPALAISAAALAHVLYNTIAFGIAGILLGLDTYLAQSHGSGT